MNTDKIDLEVERLLSELINFDINSDEYKKTIEAIRSLTEVKAKNLEAFKIYTEAVKIENESKFKFNRFGLTPDTVFSGLISILGIGIIVSYEHIHIITSKAISHVRKL